MIMPYPSPVPAEAAGFSAATPLAQPSITRTDPFPQLYVHVMLGLLPTLLAAGTIVSPGIKNETDYLPDGFSFALTVEGTDLRCACSKGTDGRWHRIHKDDPAAQTCTYTITFRDVDYAFLVFAGGITLKDALAGHYFSTQGPNNTGVALTYIFDIILRTFFFWRAAYREG